MISGLHSCWVSVTPISRWGGLSQSSPFWFTWSWTRSRDIDIKIPSPWVRRLGCYPDSLFPDGVTLGESLKCPGPPSPHRGREILGPDSSPGRGRKGRSHWLAVRDKQTNQTQSRESWQGVREETELLCLLQVGETQTRVKKDGLANMLEVVSRGWVEWIMMQPKKNPFTYWHGKSSQRERWKIKVYNSGMVHIHLFKNVGKGYVIYISFFSPLFFGGITQNLWLCGEGNLVAGGEV